MYRVQLKICEHFVDVYIKTKNSLVWLEKYSPFRTDDPHEADICVELTDGYGIAFSNFKVDITKEKYRKIYRRADYYLEVDASYKNVKLAAYDEFAFKHAFMNLYSSYIVDRNWGLMIHSSCVLEDGEAHLFSGYSGAGKSTVAKLSFPRPLLSDEATLVKISKEYITILDSPFRSELESRGNTKHFRLKSIQLLVQSPLNNRILIKKSDALTNLMDKVFFWTNDPEETKRILSLLLLLVKNVPVYELHFQKSNSFWELIS